MKHISLLLSNGLITGSGLESSYLRVDLRCEVRLGLLTRGGGLGRSFQVYLRNYVRFVEFGVGRM